MKFKLIACDLDGTLLRDDSTVSAENFSAINTLVKSAVEFVVCTGRTFYEIPKELLECDDIRYIIYSDGSAAYDKKEQKQLFAPIFLRHSKAFPITVETLIIPTTACIGGRKLYRMRQADRLRLSLFGTFSAPEYPILIQ